MLLTRYSDHDARYHLSGRDHRRIDVRVPVRPGVGTPIPHLLDGGKHGLGQ